MNATEFDRRSFLAAAAAGIAAGPVGAASKGVLRPEEFGARGDGVTNDSAAFAALSAEVNRLGGGTIELGARRTYIVGAQARGGRRWAWTPSPLLELHDLSAPLRILGNGARLRCDAGLRFGTFDRNTDEPTNRPMPNHRVDELASPYSGLIHVRDCRAPMEIRDVELDGNLEQLRIGGRFGDKGWQLPATGLLLRGNLAEEIIENVYSHHHGQDGAMFIGTARRTGRTRVRRLVCRYNARQGLSITAGRGFDLEDCEFSQTGRSVISSAPSAGVDIEAQKEPVRDLTFTRCKFIDNRGVGMLAESGDGEDARFDDCLFIGATTWSAWPRKPRFRFNDCTFVGSVVNAFADPDPNRAAQFVHCRFTDDPKLSPTGKVFLGQGPIVNLGRSDNVLFDRCTFDLVGEGVLPWSWRATYRDCTMKQRSTKKSGKTKGKFLGTTTISGWVDLHGSKVLGTVIVNGKVVPKGLRSGKPW